MLDGIGSAHKTAGTADFSFLGKEKYTTTLLGERFFNTRQGISQGINVFENAFKGQNSLADGMVRDTFEELNERFASKLADGETILQWANKPANKAEYSRAVDEIADRLTAKYADAVGMGAEKDTFKKVSKGLVQDATEVDDRVAKELIEKNLDTVAINKLKTGEIKDLL